MTAIFLCLAIGIALAHVLPTGVKAGAKYERPTEADFEELLRRRGLL